MTAFQIFVNNKYLLNHSTYNELHAWSVSSPIDFWKAIIEFNEIIYQGSLEPSSEDGMKMPGTRWFPNMKLNFAQNLLRINNNKIAIESHREDGTVTQISYKQLYDKVKSSSEYLASIGVVSGDRVAAIIPNTAEAIILMIATASLGAIWTSSSPDFGEDAILERFQQIAPKILVASTNT